MYDIKITPNNKATIKINVNTDTKEQFWQSEPQELTLGGKIQIAHGLNLTPHQCKTQVVLVCTTPTDGYALGEEITQLTADYQTNPSPPINLQLDNTNAWTFTGWNGTGIKMIDKNANLVNADPNIFKLKFKIWHNT